MVVIHIESGIGNQMLSYCEYLSLKYANPDDDFYIENIIFDIPECNEVICQWNGYELQRIFGINSPKNIRTLFSDNEWKQIVEEIRETKFWIHNWNYPVAFTKVFAKHGLILKNIRGNFDPLNNIVTGCQKEGIVDNLRKQWFWVTMKRFYSYLREDKIINSKSNKKNLFYKTSENIFTGQWLSLKFRGNDRELLDREIRETFVFPDFNDDKNIKFAKFLDSVNSVAIHARRGDALGGNGWCYKYGYFKRAVKYIRKHVENPVFVFFTNSGSIAWCRENYRIFGLDYSRDKVLYVDWNSGLESYRDMQLMAHCKHAIITNSTFGWWGAYFITNPNKITISPIVEMDTIHHC